ncbi:MAG TPA: tRNA pseudouridine(55) synthase TruB [Gammaproteobacteria bacterium]|nr:tRNA pseudouridine(55) synthase TruB [Gammaproteobacteria bacterium]
MARRQKGRNVTGILLLDKPGGMTSNKVLQEVKQLFFARKAGHTGSLDPLATGMLPICFGDATKVSGFLLDADKRYTVTCKLGIKTTTADSEGDILEQRSVPELDHDGLEAVLDQYRGDIEQIPPMHSALKHNGERLYNLARQGIEVERQARSVTIYELSLLSLNKDELELEVHCTKGTYVRTLVEDIGESIGCGAHVIQLRRLAVGAYQDPAGMITLDVLREMEQADRETRGGYAELDKLMHSVESALGAWPDVQLTEDATYYLRQGQPVLVKQSPTEGLVRLFNPQFQFIGVGEIQEDGMVAPRRLFGAGKG